MSNPDNPKPPVTVLGSFDRFLPQYPNLQDNKKPAAHVSSNTVLQQRPPVFAIKQEQDYWIEKSKEFLKNKTVRDILSKEYMVEKDHSTRHVNEANVVHSLISELLYPACRAMGAMFGPNFARKLEISGDHVRGDIAFLWSPPVPIDYEIKELFKGMLEVKRRGVIRPDQFENAQLWNLKESEDPDKTARQRDVEIAKYVKEADEKFKNESGLGDPTLFKGNALKLVKQASAYSERYRIQYVGLSDYDYLVLLRFPRLAQQANGNYTVGPYCHVSIFDVKNTFVRHAMLGFLVELYGHKPHPK